MGDTNYFGGIVKILEPPRQKILKNKIPVVQFRAQLPQVRNSRIVELVFWSNLGQDVLNYYKPNDYILIEGYSSILKKKSTKIPNKISKKVKIKVQKIYPFLLNYNRSSDSNQSLNR